MTDEPIRIDDLSRIDVRRVTGAEDDLYALAASGKVWVHNDPGWTALPPLETVTFPAGTYRRRAIDFYMHASRYDGHGSDIHEHHKFALRVFDDIGTLWELHFVQNGYVWDKVTP